MAWQRLLEDHAVDVVVGLEGDQMRA